VLGNFKATWMAGLFTTSYLGLHDGILPSIAVSRKDMDGYFAAKKLPNTRSIITPVTLNHITNHLNIQQ
jgi:hypothetical protein